MHFNKIILRLKILRGKSHNLLPGRAVQACLIKFSSGVGTQKNFNFQKNFNISKFQHFKKISNFN